MFALPETLRRPVAMIVQFNYEDNEFWPGGLTTSTGQRKPSYAAFVAQSRKRLSGFERRSIR